MGAEKLKEDRSATPGTSPDDYMSRHSTPDRYWPIGEVVIDAEGPLDLIFIQIFSHNGCPYRVGEIEGLFANDLLKHQRFPFFFLVFPPYFLSHFLASLGSRAWKYLRCFELCMARSRIIHPSHEDLKS